MYLKKLKTIRINNFAPDFSDKVSAMMADVNLAPDQDYVIVYDNYSSDYKGDYDMTVALPSTEADHDIFTDYDLTPHSDKKVFGKDIDITSLKDIWKLIWRLEDNDLLSRQYDRDFEIHPANGDLDIWLSVSDENDMSTNES